MMSQSQEGAFLFTTSCLASGAFGSMLSAGSKAQSFGLGNDRKTRSLQTERGCSLFTRCSFLFLSFPGRRFSRDPRDPELETCTE